MRNGRCRMRGGASTGPRMPESLVRSTAARRRYGKQHVAARAQTKERATARVTVAELRRLPAKLDAQRDFNLWLCRLLAGSGWRSRRA